MTYYQIKSKSLLLSHHHSTSALVSEILKSVLQTVQKKIKNVHMDSTYLLVTLFLEPCWNQLIEILQTILAKTSGEVCGFKFLWLECQCISEAERGVRWECFRALIKDRGGLIP